MSFPSYKELSIEELNQIIDCCLTTLLILIFLTIGFFIDPIKTLIILAFIVLPIILGYITYKILSKNGRAKQ